MNTIAIITAMESEYNAIHSQYKFIDSQSGSIAEIYGKKVLLIKSGIGKVHGALATAKACLTGADLVITTGLAGGIDSSLRQGDVVLAEKVCYHDVWCGAPNAKGQVQDMPLYYETPQNILEKCLQNAPRGYFHQGMTVTGDQFLTDAIRLKEIKTDFPEGLAVDMESAAVAQTCHLNNIPFISLRIISDVVGKPEQQEMYDAFWQNVPHKAAEMVDIVLKNI
ncbi:MAG: 5'-methylthioadenosine/S-adenosylhomocysteine nucleosidase [Acetobacter sp.]|nr:5'-methylthioadenosine/S-adenosylhomocysteine nucleosidase [Acetobacter sp.]